MMKRFSKDDNKIYLHAEIDALLTFFVRYQERLDSDMSMAEKLSNANVYVARVLKDGSPALAKPCDTCLGALMYFGILPENIHWTT